MKISISENGYWFHDFMFPGGIYSYAAYGIFHKFGIGIIGLRISNGDKMGMV